MLFRYIARAKSAGLSLTSQAVADPLEVNPIRRAFRVTQNAPTASRYCYILVPLIGFKPTNPTF